RWDGDVAGGFIERLVLALRARGHSVHVVAPADEGVGGTELRHQVPVTGVRYAPARWETLAYRGTLAAGVRSPAGLLWAASLVWRQARVLARLWRDERLDVVHAHWWIPAGVSASLAGRPYVVTLHGSDVALLERSRLARLVARRVLHRAARVTAVSSYLAQRASRAVRLAPARILVQSMPLDTRAFTRTSRGGGGVVTVGAVTGTVPEPGDGRLVTPDRPRTARAIEQPGSDPGSRRRAAAAGVALRRRCGPAVVAEHFEALYAEVAAQRSRGERA